MEPCVDDPTLGQQTIHYSDAETINKKAFLTVWSLEQMKPKQSFDKTSH